jgi:hypothetical protein
VSKVHNNNNNNNSFAHVQQSHKTQFSTGDLIPVLFGRREGVSGSINAMKIVTV